jgi:hypothetical protein
MVLNIERARVAHSDRRARTGTRWRRSIAVAIAVCVQPIGLRVVFAALIGSRLG